MSNNKQSMKLYTEEQVRKAIKYAEECRDIDTSVENGIIALLTPIELPSDEEMVSIKNVFEFAEWMSSLINSNYKSSGNWYYNKAIYTTKQLYEKWLRDKIQGGEQ